MDHSLHRDPTQPFALLVSPENIFSPTEALREALDYRLLYAQLRPGATPLMIALASVLALDGRAAQ